MSGIARLQLSTRVKSTLGALGSCKGQIGPADVWISLPGTSRTPASKNTCGSPAFGWGGTGNAASLADTLAHMLTTLQVAPFTEVHGTCVCVCV